jgi:carboxyl-terminal processing protease
LEYTNSENKPLKVSLKRKPTGTKWFQLGVMPASAVCFEYKKLPDSIAYVRMSPCFTDQIMMFRNIIPDLSTQRGLIIDLRNNPGGLMLFPDAMGGWLSDKKIFFGKMKTRTTTLDLQSYPQKEAFKGPLALLIDGGTASVAEIFVAGLQDAGRATLFGECSSGACLPSIFIEINRGYRLQTICGDFTRNNGKAIEKIGVTPDYPVTIKTDDLLKGNDSVIEAAVKWILGEKTQVAYLRKYSLFP